MTWPGDGTKLLSSDGSQVVVGSGLDLSAGQLSASGSAWPGASSQMVASDGSTVSVGSGLNLAAGTISSTDVKCTYVPAIVGDGSAQLVASSIGDVIYSGDGIYVCTALSPLTWKKFSINSTIQVGASVSYRYYRMVINGTKVTDAGVTGTDQYGIQFAELELLSVGSRVNYTGAVASISGGLSPGGQTPTQGIDNNSATKWFTFTNPSVAAPVIFTIDFGSLRSVSGFRYMTAGDIFGRDPIRWSFEGSSDNSTWVVLHSQTTNASITNSRLTWTQEFTFSS